MKKHYYLEEILTVCDKKHLTVEEIFFEIKEKFPDAWKSSIYRNVEKMAEDWVLKKMIWIWKKAYFEKNIWEHIHLICEKTWKIFDLTEKISLPENFLPENFKAKNMDLKIFWEFA